MLKSRKITNIIKKWLLEKEYIILNGARQVGKTSLLRILMLELQKTGISENSMFYLNLEEIKILETLNSDPENILNYIINKKEVNYFFIDEIQYLDNPSNFLKHIFDKYASKIKIIATGSSSIELKAKFQDSLAGRKISFMINPLDFEEFLIFKNFKHLDYYKKDIIPDDIKYEFIKQLNQYLLFGGMPAVVLQDDKEKKKILLNEYVNTYVNKDIRFIGKIENIAGFNSLIKVIASQIGNLLNISELSNTINIPRRKVEKYLNLLKYTYVINEITPFKKNIRTQIAKMPKTYFFDLGIRNAILGNFLEIENRQAEAGRLFENFIFLELKNKFKDKIYFYRTLSKTEIDVIIEDSNKIILVEVKYKKIKAAINTRLISSLRDKIENKTEAFVVNLNYLGSQKDISYVDYRNLGNKII